MTFWFSRLKACPKCALDLKPLLHPWCAQADCPARLFTKHITGQRLSANEKQREAAWRHNVEESGALEAP